MSDTARRAVAELAASQHRTFTRRQAAELNFDRRRVATATRTGWLDEPLPGVLVIRDGPSTWEQRLMVVVLAAGAHGVASHRSAARLHGLDGFDGATNATVEVSVHRAFRLGPEVVAVTHHVGPMEPCDITVVRGIPCTALQRTLCDLGSVVDPMLVRRALTSARRRGIDLDGLWAVAERLHRPYQRGTGTLMTVLRQVPHEGTLPATWFEELVALCVADSSLPRLVFAVPDHGRNWQDHRPRRPRLPERTARARGPQQAVPLGRTGGAARRRPRHRRVAVWLGAHVPRLVCHEATHAGARSREGSRRRSPP